MFMNKIKKFSWECTTRRTCKTQDTGQLLGKSAAIICPHQMIEMAVREREREREVYFPSDGVCPRKRGQTKIRRYN